MRAEKVLLDCMMGRHKAGQVINLIKYVTSDKKIIIDWEPISVSAFPTFKCNFSCDMCLTHSTKFENPNGQRPCCDMDLALFKSVLKKYKNAIMVSLIGNGEPLFNKDLFKMIEYASKVMKMYTFSSSNGLIVGDYIDRIISSSLTGFTVSLNGHNSNEFNRMTGMRAQYFNTICNNIAELTRQRDINRSELEISVSVVLDKDNHKYLTDIIYFIDELGADKMLFFQFLPTDMPGFTAEERCLFSDDMDVVESFKSAENLPKKIKEKVSLPPLLDRGMNYKYCSVPFYNISVDGSGDMGCCSCQLLNFSGNGKFDDAAAWNNNHFKDMRRRFLDPEFPILQPCMHCYNNTGKTRLASNPNLFHGILRKYLPV